MARLEQDRLSRELEDLQRNINKKEELASLLKKPSEETNNLRAQYEKQLKDLENNRSKLEKERTDLVMVICVETSFAKHSCVGFSWMLKVHLLSELSGVVKFLNTCAFALSL